MLYINSVIRRISILQQWFKRLIKPPHPLWTYDFPDGKAAIEIRQPFLVWLLIGLLALYIFIPKAMVVICLATLLGICICSYIWVRTQVMHIHAQRKLLFAAVQVGDELEENIQIINSGILPVLWIAVEDNSNFPAYSIRSVRAVDPQSKTTWRYHLTCKQRGIFTLGPWQWISSDPFGIFYLRRSYLHTQQMVVYPPLALLPASLLPIGRQVGDLRPLNQPLAAETILATHTRPFQPGDPLRRVHWRTTARRGSPYIKIFDPEAASRVWLIPDLDAKVHSNPSKEIDDWQDSSEENMILLLSALASQLLQDHRAVGLFAGSELGPDCSSATWTGAFLDHSGCANTLTCDSDPILCRDFAAGCTAHFYPGSDHCGDPFTGNRMDDYPRSPYTWFWRKFRLVVSTGSKKLWHGG